MKIQIAVNERYIEQKNAIEFALNSMRLEEAYKLIKQYEETAPKDMDIISYKSIYYMYSDDIEMALDHAKEGVRRYPTSADMYYNLASAYEMAGNIIEAYVCFLRSYNLNTILYHTDDINPGETGYDAETAEHIMETKEHIRELKSELEYIFSTEQDESVREQIALLKSLDRSGITRCVRNMLLCGSDCTIGDYYIIDHKDRMYVADYRMQSAFGFVPNDRYNTFEMAAEIRHVTEGNAYSAPSDNSASEYLLPIASKNEFTSHEFKKDEKKVTVLQTSAHHFNYYRVVQGTGVTSSDNCYYGNPIRLEHNPDRKRLVISIFVDGLSQIVLENMKEIMPNTWNFFSANGFICRNAHSTAEWTYPSVASFNTGLYTTDHMLFHPDADTLMPADVTLLAEYYKQMGYYTARIGGNWRITPNYGYGRGFDQIIYRSQYCGFRLDEIMGTVIDHICAFDETDQFLAIDMIDLHNVADYFDLPLSAQTKTPINMRDVGFISDTSVQQTYDEKKIFQYRLMMSSIDSQLKALYDYINDNYKSNEVVVSLFSDHGQGYLIPKNGFFMGPERTNVAFMFRSDVDIGNIYCDELISGVDYVPIMCHLSDIKMHDENIDGKLPRFLGGKGHEYIISESIHPDQPYRAVLYTDELMVCFDGHSPIGHDGRFQLNDFDISVYERNTNIPIKDDEIVSKYLDIILEHIAGLIVYV